MPRSLLLCTAAVLLACIGCFHNPQHTRRHSNSLGHSEINGCVLDGNSNPVPYAAVQLESASLGDIRVVTTDAGGHFAFLQLPQSNDYLLFVEMSGYPRTGYSNIELRAFTTITIDVFLLSCSIIPIFPHHGGMIDYNAVGGGAVYQNDNNEAHGTLSVR